MEPWKVFFVDGVVQGGGLLWLNLHNDYKIGLIFKQVSI